MIHCGVLKFDKRGRGLNQPSVIYELLDNQQKRGINWVSGWVLADWARTNALSSHISSLRAILRSGYYDTPYSDVVCQRRVENGKVRYYYALERKS